MNIAICDDDISTLNAIEDTILNQISMKLSCDVFTTGVALIDYLDSNKEYYNIYILDIEMPGLSGIETAKIIRQTDQQALIIYNTSHKNYVYDVFETLPFRFLSKPNNIDKLKTCLFDAISHINKFGQVFFFNIGHTKYSIPYYEILYFESIGRKVKLVTSLESYFFYYNTKHLVKTLNSHIFVQIHASYIVNMEYIIILRQDSLELKNKIVLPISRKYLPSVRKNQIDYLERWCGK